MSFGVSGKYRLERRLGGGGMAEVFAGSTVGAEGFSRPVAIKRVLPGYSGNSGFAQMFVSEARISSQLVHPNIVSVLDFDRDAEGRLFLVMELVDGKDLDALNETGPLPLPVVIFIIVEVLRGLGFAHDLPTGSGLRGVVHRDVSPHNVLLSWEGAVKVSDFGIAKVRAASAATASAFIKGKPAYMSPEQANAQRLDGRSDLFAVGVMLWEMLCGKRLFVAEDTRATLAAVLFGQIPRPRTVRPELPRDLERVTMRLLERDLALRYATAEEALGDLMSCGDAPRTGREALIAVLGERFPDDAPVRQSVARRNEPTAQAPAVLDPGPVTLTGSTSGAIAPALGPAAVPVAPTSTLETSTIELPTRPRRMHLVVLLAIAAASGTVAFAAVSTLLAPPGDAPARAPEPSVPGASAVADAAPQPAAPPDGPADAAIALDAAPEAPKSGEIGGRSGSLYVVGTPILTITVDGTLHGESPRTIALPVGTHRVRIQNLESHIDELLPDVIIRANETTTIDRMPR